MQYQDNQLISDQQRKLLDQVYSLAISVLPSKVDWSDQNQENFIAIVNTFFLTKYLRTYKAMTLLMDNNYGEDVAILSRSLFEILIKVLHLHLFPSPDLYLHKIQFGRSMLNDTKRFMKIHGSPLPDNFDYGKRDAGVFEEIKTLIAELETIDAPLAQKVRNNKFDFWPQKSLRQMLKEIKSIPADIYTLYEIFSDLLHSNVGTFNNYIDPITGDTTTNPSGVFTRSAGYTAAAGLIEILRIMVDGSNKDIKQSIDVLAGHLNIAFQTN
jgi:hypothetical protein